MKDYECPEFDYVIMICGNEYNACPFFLGGKKIFLESIRDIYSFRITESEEVKLLRGIRDEIGDWVQDFFNYKICNPDQKTGVEQECCEEKKPLMIANAAFLLILLKIKTFLN